MTFRRRERMGKRIQSFTAMNTPLRRGLGVFLLSRCRHGLLSSHSLRPMHAPHCDWTATMESAFGCSVGEGWTFGIPLATIVGVVCLQDSVLTCIKAMLAALN